MHKSYYEAILQLRPDRKDVRDFIYKSLDDRGNVSLVKIVRIKKGVDLYLSSWKFATSLGSDLVKKFGGKVQVTKKIYGKKKETGKTVYRASVLFRFPEYKVGDIISQNNNVFLVTSVGKSVFGRNLMKTKKEKIKEGDIKILEVVKVVVSKYIPQLEVIHPHTYQSTPVVNNSKTPHRKVSVALKDDEVWFVK